MNKIIFSTRYIKDDYLFHGDGNPYGQLSELSKYFDKHIWKDMVELSEFLNTYSVDANKYLFDPKDCIQSARNYLDNVLKQFLNSYCEDDFEELKKYIKNNNEDGAEIFYFNCLKDADKRKRLFNVIKNYYNNPDAKDATFVDKYVKNCPGENIKEKLKARYSYYKLESNNEDCQVFAVPHLDWQDGEKWINALLKEESFGAKENDDIYLILHDGDLVGFQHTPFQKIKKEDVKANYGGGNNVHILVFQHTSNAIVDLLKNSSLNAADVEKIIIGIFKNADHFSEIFTSNNSTRFDNLEPTANLDGAKIDFDLEKAKNQIKTVKFLDGGQENNNKYNQYYIFDDIDGALLCELMHSTVDLRNENNPFRKLLDYCFRNCNDESPKLPIIVKVYKSLFDDWIEKIPSSNSDRQDKVNAIKKHRNNKSLEKNLTKVLSFFNNSSIWIRIVDKVVENNAQSSAKADEEFKDAVNELGYFYVLGLYEYSSAQEYIEYNKRILNDNYLDTQIGGHSHFVTPVLYGDEIKSRNELLDNSVVKTKLENK